MGGVATGGDAAARVLLHVRPGCSLCTAAREVVSTVCTELGETWREVDVDGPAGEVGGLRARYTDLVPVVTVDGHHHDHWRIDPERLREALGPARR